MGRGSYLLVILLIFGIVSIVIAFLPCVLDKCKDA